MGRVAGRGRKPMTGEYALYKGEDLLSIGTVAEICKDMNICKNTLKTYHSNAYKRDRESRKPYKGGPRVLVKLEDEEE